jgi:hypothetical protein
VIDILEHLNAVQREVSRTGETVTVLCAARTRPTPRRCGTPSPARSGCGADSCRSRATLKVGGSFQLEGNAGGDILECDPPKRFKVTFGGPTSLLELRLLPGTAASTDLELEHSMSGPPAPGGSGALWVGPGWDGALLGLALYVTGTLPPNTDPTEMANSPEVITYNEQSVRAWIKAIRTSGTTTEQDLTTAAKLSLSQYAPDAEL